ncbi:MAG: flavodoxin family protein [Defluviitaleaceae bacterium]|nr:flavodoxin family protein [Defluviitaleaceae bacterium]
MKVFAYVGTSRGETSNAFKVTQAVIDQMSKDYSGKLESNIYHPENTNIESCDGIINCFGGKACPLEVKDDMVKIKKAMLDADVIIIASPVRMHHVSGSVKTFFDRLAYWAHVFKLTGKIGLSISVSSTNGNEFVDYYLDKLHMYLGIYTVDPLSLPMDVIDADEKAGFILEASEALLNAYQNSYNLKPSQKQELAFQTFKAMYLKQERKTSESRYWIDHGLASFETFQDFRSALLKNNELKRKVNGLY